MNDSETFDRLTEKHEQNERARLDAVRRWAAYIREQPPEVWGPQQNEVVDAQLESAAHAAHSAAHVRRVRGFAQEELERSEE